MAKFSSPEKQAAAVMKQLQSTIIRSLGTVRIYEAALTRVAEYLRENRLGSLRSLDKKSAENYLENRAYQVGQSQLNSERQALQKMMQRVTRKLAVNEKLSVVKSNKTEVLKGRAYTKSQVHLISEKQHLKNEIATELAFACGIRAHELYSIRPANEQPPSKRISSQYKFAGREGVLYTVVGKGGLVREILVPKKLSQRLENLRINAPACKTDRGINYKSHYQINAGARWSNSFSYASKKALGYSNGAHGLRHSYAQERYHELLNIGHSKKLALEVVSQELGHFRSSITLVYLR